MGSKSDTATCCAKVPKGSDGWRTSYKPCTRQGKVERYGKWYCGQHDPQAREDRYQKKRDQWKVEAAEQERQRRIAEAAPNLLALLIESRTYIGGDWRERRDAAIVKATEGQIPDATNFKRLSFENGSQEEAFLRTLIDLTWGEAFEDRSVPSTATQTELIERARRAAGV